MRSNVAARRHECISPLATDWTRDELLARDVSWWSCAVRRAPPGFCRPCRYQVVQRLLLERSASSERRVPWRSALEQERPLALIVIQDTLLLERFLVRAANRLGIPTVVIQWAFNFPQDYYDRLRALKVDSALAGSRANRPSLGLYRAVQEILDVDFELVNSYGGGEARAFAVMGPHFADQYRAQGVAGKAIVVTGHPLHDAAFRHPGRWTRQSEPLTLAIRNSFE